MSTEKETRHTETKQKNIIIIIIYIFERQILRKMYGPSYVNEVWRIKYNE
jgi:hypothetical protein